MIPIHDDNPTTRTPALTLLLIAGCIGAYVWFVSLDLGSQEGVVYTLGAVPALLTGEVTFQPYFDGFPAPASVVTMLFMHAGLVHLGGNMLYLWIFGNNVEDRLGHGRFLALYLLAGLAGTAAHVASNPASDVPLIGASGAISGVLGAYLLLYPFARVRMIVPPFLFRTFHVPAWAFLGFWFVLQIYNAAGDVYLATGVEGVPEGGVAWSAHAAGFVAGIVLLLVLKPAGVTLFARRAGSPARDRGATTRAKPGPWGKTKASKPEASPASRVETVSATKPTARRIVSR